jgi:class 3 adenylate cyclase
VISAATYQLVQGLFTCQALGTPALKGVAQPLGVGTCIVQTLTRALHVP